jgi:CRISPR/Cas system CMR subunit Cmr4 (Cas7 group RAMP superfamily)
MRRTIARFTLELLSPMHIGSGLGSPATDAPVVRDGFGDYRIPGSSLAGALRAATGDSSSAWGSAGREGNAASSIEVSDGFLVDFDGRVALGKRLAGQPVAYQSTQEIQEHVRIDHDTGAAEEGGKFDAEIIPQGTRFRCELSLVTRTGTSREDGEQARAAFLHAVALLQSGELSLGGDVSSGLGLVRIVGNSLSIGDHDLATRRGLEAARGLPADIGLPAGTDTPESLHFPQVTDHAVAASEPGLVHGTITIHFEADGPLLVGGSQRPSSKADTDKNLGADLVFGEALVADYPRQRLVARPWVPGSSLRGALRHRVLHVLESLGRADSQAIAADLFGSVDGDTGTASKVRMFGCFLEDEKRTAVQHVAIDRLTGGSLQSALYSEAPIWRDGLRIELRLTLDGASDAQCAALAHALIDMGTGHLPIGGGTRRGNGRLRFADDTAGFRGKSIRFALRRGESRICHDSPTQAVDAFIDMLEQANGRLAGATA